MSGARGRTSSVKAIRIFTISLRSSLSNSRTRLLASTTSAGSIKTVFPDADSSCTIPFNFRLKAGATGITNRPSRMVGLTSFSTNPSDCAARNIAFRLLEIPPDTWVISLRIRFSSGDALSLMRPYLSSILSIRVRS